MRPFVALSFILAGAVVPHPVNYVAPPAPAPFTTATQAEGVTTVH